VVEKGLTATPTASATPQSGGREDLLAQTRWVGEVRRGEACKGLGEVPVFAAWKALGGRAMR
jgi:hypothetical protein